jgi:hypothetical protein
VHGSENIIAAGAGDDAICLFAEEKSNMVSYHPIHMNSSHDFNFMCRVLVAGLFKIIYAGDVENLKYMVPIVI